MLLSHVFRPLGMMYTGRQGRSCNHFAHTYVQRLILLATPLFFVAGLVGAMHREGSNTIVARESIYMYCTIPIRIGLWKLGFISQQYFVCGYGVAQVGISYLSF